MKELKEILKPIKDKLNNPSTRENAIKEIGEENKKMNDE